MTTNAQSLYDQLKGAGLNQAASLAVVGNVLAEAGARPNALGDNGHSHGLAQWQDTKLGGLRWQRLVAWAKRLGKDPSTFETQSAYLVQDLQSYSSGKLWKALNSTSDAYTASALVLRSYERPKVQTDAEAERRAKLAINAGLLNSGKPLVDPGNIAPDTSGTATATGGEWKGFDLLPDWKSFAVYGAAAVVVLVLAVAALLQLTKPVVQPIAKAVL